jgi:hypothetical protein
VTFCQIVALILPHRSVFAVCCCSHRVSAIEMKLALSQEEESQCTVHRGNSARIDHEGFYCNRGYAVATDVLATQ